jgi:hypothetical protein
MSVAGPLAGGAVTLTEHDIKPTLPPTGRHDETEVVVTEDMIEAGAEALAGFNPDFETLEGAAERVYIAMKEVSPKEKLDQGP